MHFTKLYWRKCGKYVIVLCNILVNTEPYVLNVESGREWERGREEIERTREREREREREVSQMIQYIQNAICVCPEHCGQPYLEPVGQRQSYHRRGA